MKLDALLKLFGFTPASADRCLYILRAQGIIIMICCVLVDDMLVGYHQTHASVYAKLIAHLQSNVNKPSDVKDLGDATGFCRHFYCSQQRKAHYYLVPAEVDRKASKSSQYGWF